MSCSFLGLRYVGLKILSIVGFGSWGFLWIPGDLERRADFSGRLSLGFVGLTHDRPLSSSFLWFIFGIP